ncbi:MAG: methionine--tRNA ligase [Spirulina sp. DLM2.Bin59]|nr:MAG: methionine--tRNA ligase [Spirulina sp. DLM2.Bin59]
MSPQPRAPFVLTTPLYYVNAAPHIGSAYTTMIADAIARFQRLRGREVLFITGTDEHGQKIQRAAAEQNIDPQTHCDRVSAQFDALWTALNIQYDRFSRTTDPRHHAIVEEFFARVWAKGDIYLSKQQGWYCVACEEFKEERDLLPGQHCPIHTNKVVEWRDEDNYFFRLSRYQERLEALYADRPDFIQPLARRNEVLNFVAQGLQDFSISRVNLTWGFPLPADPAHTFYVWFDALLGYVTALLPPDGETTLDNALGQGWPINLHLIGKDILRFHAVYWPAMLMAAEIDPPIQIFGHGFLTKDGRKMGKSLGNTIDPVDLVDRYGADSVRYYFLKEIEVGLDGDFNETRFVHILNADLANDFGNLLNRTLGMVKKYCQGQLPDLDPEDLPAENPLAQVGKTLGDRLLTAYEQYQFHQVCEEILNLIRAGNRFIDEQAPWSLYKQGKQSQVEQVLYSVLESVRLSAYLIAPIVPNLSGKIYHQLGLNVDFNDPDHFRSHAPFSEHSQWGVLRKGQPLPNPSPVFAKLELPPTPDPE